jgi:hypothetical protein
MPVFRAVIITNDQLPYAQDIGKAGHPRLKAFFEF